MSHLVLAFTKLHPLIPIRHVALVHGDQVIESSGFRTRGLPAGARMRWLFDFMDQHPDMELRMARHSDPQAVWDFCCERLGAAYDWSWYMGLFGFGRNWQDPAKWVCHELIAEATAACGEPIVDVTLPWITPDHLYAASFGDEYAGL